MHTHTYDVNLVARRTTKWSGSTSIQRSGDHFMNASMKAAVHVGTDSGAIVRVKRTPEFSQIRLGSPSRRKSSLSTE